MPSRSMWYVLIECLVYGLLDGDICILKRSQRSWFPRKGWRFGLFVSFISITWLSKFKAPFAPWLAFCKKCQYLHVTLCSGHTITFDSPYPARKNISSLSTHHRWENRDEQIHLLASNTTRSNFWTKRPPSLHRNPNCLITPTPAPTPIIISRFHSPLLCQQRFCKSSNLGIHYLDRWKENKNHFQKMSQNHLKIPESSLTLYISKSLSRLS